jgi:site-specific recombinase XerD
MKYRNEKTLYNYIDQFEKKLERNKSKHTIINYLSDLKVFAKWLISSEKVNDIEQFTQEDFLDYLDFLKSKFAASTVKRRAISLNEFLIFLNRTGRLKKAPFVDNKEMTDYLPVIPKSRTKSLSKAQIKNLVFACENLLEECIIRFSYDTGCRVSETVRAKRSDIYYDFDHITLRVSGKGKGGMSKERNVMISKKTSDKLEELWKTFDFEPEFIFTSQRTKKPISERRVNQIVSAVGKRCGIDELSSHIFRKSIGTNLLKSGLELAYVSEYLGHDSTDTTYKNYLDTVTDLHDKVHEFYEEI